MTENDTRQFYDADARSYDAGRWLSPAGEMMDAVHKGLVENALTSVRDARLVEVACGTGRFAIHLTQAGFDVTACDISPEMLAQARQKALAAGIDAAAVDRWSVASGDGLPFGDGEFGGAYMINAASHIPNIDPVLADIRRVLAPGAPLVINFPNLLSPYLPVGLYITLRGRSIQRDVFTRWHTNPGFEKRLERAGFAVIESWGHFNFPDRFNSPGALRLFAALDRRVRNSGLRFFAPTVYIKAVAV